MPHLLFLSEGSSGKQSSGRRGERQHCADQSLLSLRRPVCREHQRRRAALQVQRKGIGPQVQSELVRPRRAAQ